MAAHSVFSIAFWRLQADQMMQRLRAAAFPAHDISVLFVSEPTIAALSDLTLGLVAQWVPLLKARFYESSIRERNLLVAVLAESAEKTTLAQQSFNRTSGDDFCNAGDVTTLHRPSFTPHLVQMTNDRLGVAS